MLFELEQINKGRVRYFYEMRCERKRKQGGDSKAKTRGKSKLLSHTERAKAFAKSAYHGARSRFQAVLGRAPKVVDNDKSADETGSEVATTS